MTKYKIVAHIKDKQSTICYTLSYGETEPREMEFDAKEDAQKIINDLKPVYSSVEHFEIIETE